MARNKIGLQFDGFDEMIAGMEKFNLDVKGATEAALKSSKQIVNAQLTKDTVKANFPARGKYSTGKLKKSIDRDFTVQWEGYTASLKIGYDFKISGMESIFLMYGTPKMPKVQKIYDDIYGTRMKKLVGKVQKEAMEKVIERAWG